MRGVGLEGNGWKRLSSLPWLYGLRLPPHKKKGSLWPSSVHKETTLWFGAKAFWYERLCFCLALHSRYTFHSGISKVGLGEAVASKVLEIQVLSPQPSFQTRTGLCCSW